MKKIIFFLVFIIAISQVRGQIKARSLTFIVMIDNNIDQDIINGKFIIKDKNRKLIDEMPFRNWVGKLEMNDLDYKKLLNLQSKDSLFVCFGNKNFELDTTYSYEAKIPRRMMNSEYLILSIYNKKNKESRDKYLFLNNEVYILQVFSPGYNTRLKYKANN
jgi:hypothetical protein